MINQVENVVLKYKRIPTFLILIELVNMKIWLLIVTLSCAISVNAQDITGNVMDENNNPIEFATVVVQTIDSIYVNSAYTDSFGIFKLNADLIPFILTVQHLIYETYRN